MSQSKFEIKESKTIFLDLTIMSKMWLFVFEYRPPNRDVTKMFFEGLSDLLKFVINGNKIKFLMNDLNITLLDKSKSN